MENAGLLSQRVKIVLRRFHQQTPSEIITPSSASERQDNEIQRRKVLTPQEISRHTGH